MNRRLAFTLLLEESNLAEYRRRHDRLWPELRAAIAEQGGSNFSLFYDSQTRRVVGYVEVADELRWAAGAESDLTQRWWRYMSEVMPTHADGGPISHELFEVFHLD